MKKKISDLIPLAEKITKNSYTNAVVNHVFSQMRHDMKNIDHHSIRIPYFGLFYISRNAYNHEIKKLINKLRVNKDPKVLERFTDLWKNRHKVYELQVYSRSSAYKAKKRRTETE